MQQAVAARQDLNERAEVRDRDHLAGVDLPDLHVAREVADRPPDGLDVVGVLAEDLDQAVVLDVDLDLHLLLEAADRLPTGADDETDLVNRNLDRDHARGEGREALARRRDDRVHHREDLQARLTSLLEALSEDLLRQALDLDVEVQAVDAVLRAGDLEVHVAGGVLEALDVGEERVAVLVLVEQADGDAGDRCLQRHAAVQHRERCGAAGGHGA